MRDKYPKPAILFAELLVVRLRLFEYFCVGRLVFGCRLSLNSQTSVLVGRWTARRTLIAGLVVGLSACSVAVTLVLVFLVLFSVEACLPSLINVAFI